MRSRIHATSQAAEDNQPTYRKIARQPLRHSNAIRGGMPRSNHRNAGLREGGNISTNVEHEWRIVDLPKS